MIYQLLESKDIDIEDTLELASYSVASTVMCGAHYLKISPTVAMGITAVGVVWADLLWMILEAAGP